ncbi:MAG: RDD family protein [Planctomycetota bacterium]
MIAWALAGLAWSWSASADTLRAAGTGERGWVAVPWQDGPDAWRVELLHGRIGEADDADGRAMSGTGRSVGEMRRTPTLKGRLMPASLAAEGDRAALLFRSGTVVAIDATRQESTGLWRYDRDVLPSLPGVTESGGRAVAATLSDGRLWVVVRGPSDAVDNATAEDTTETAGEAEAMTRRLDDPRVRRAIGLPVRPTTPATQDGAPANPPADDDAAGSAAAVDTAEAIARDRMWLLSRGAWSPVAMPSEWSQTVQGVALGPDGEGAGGVWLIGETSAGQWRAWVGAADDETTDEAGAAVEWSAVDAPTVAWRGDTIEATRVGRQPVALAQRGAELVAWALRPGGLTRLGTLPIGVSEQEAWGVVGAGNEAWAVVGPVEDTSNRDGSGDAAEREEVDGLRAGGLTLDGRRTPTGPVEMVTQPLLPGSPGMLVEAVVLIASISMIGWYWRRDPEQRAPRLSEAAMIGTLSQRLSAAIVDILPVFGLGCLVWRMSPTELLAHWPGSSNTSPDWWGLMPGASVIVGVIVHTTIAEAITGRSLGKRMMGLRVVALDGTRPKRSQVVTRGVLRCMELIAWLLALVPVLGPYRQRLGDLVAGTVVIVDQGEPADDPPSEEDDDPPHDDDDRGSHLDRRA